MAKLDQNEVLADFTSRLDQIGIEYMLTGSMAMAHYAIPRSTADIDVVINLRGPDIEKFIREFESDYYIPLTRARESGSTGHLFNVLHQDSVMKIICIPLKSDSYSINAFARRKVIPYTTGFSVSIISKEDLVISKLQWAKETGSEMQLRDVSNILRHGIETDYFEKWIEPLGVSDLLEKCLRLINQNDAE